MGNKSPLISSPNLIEKGLDLKLKNAKYFGQALALFIGQSEPSSTLGRLAHCLRSLNLPHIDLEAASSDRNRHLQVPNPFGRNPWWFFSNSGHPGGCCRLKPLQRLLPRPLLVQPSAWIGQKRRPATCGRFPIGQSFA